MENEPKISDAEVASSETKSTINNPVPPTGPNQNKKTPVWVWILSGCLIVSVLTMILFGLLGYWGFHKAKREIDKQKPNFDQMQKDFEKAGKDAEEWQKKAEEIQKTMPNPEDIKYPMPE